MSAPTTTRFDYAGNLSRAGTYRGYRSQFWPPAGTVEVHALDLSAPVPELGPRFRPALAELKGVIESEWAVVKQRGVPGRRRFNDPAPIAAALRAIGALLPAAADQRATRLRADAVESGYSDDALAELAKLEEEITVVAGQVSTWYGKELRGLPTAFGCRRDEAQQQVVQRALDELAEVPDYLRALRPGLALGDFPAFGAAQMFFMAGEGNLHPKHIAYFLPEDEGVKQSPFKKTYYFTNTHQALLHRVGAPLAAALLRTEHEFDAAATASAGIPTLGVLGHELGHFVHRPTTSFAELNATHRWASVSLQEVSADVFGTLLLAQVWAGPLGLSRAEVVTYYLQECLRYVNRGLGHFPDSDGMYLQLSYLVQLGALQLEPGGRLVADTETVLAGLRSLARVLADTLLAGDVARSIALFTDFGPARPAALAPLIDQLDRLCAGSIEYDQEHLYPEGSRDD